MEPKKQPSDSNIINTPTILSRIPICRRTLITWCRNGMPHLKIGKLVLFHWPTVEAWMIRQQRAK